MVSVWGVLYDNKGDIVTNAHVVGSDTSFTVSFSNGKTVPGGLVGTYVPDDIAVISVAAAKGLTPARFGNSSSLQVGDIVLAIGNPLGLSSSVTDGIVSFNGRAVSEGNGVVLPDLIQTSAAINPGNSGGALVNLSGRVVGIPTLAATNGDAAAPGLGFAIPSRTVALIAPQLIAKGAVTAAGRGGARDKRYGRLQPCGRTDRRARESCARQWASGQSRHSTQRADHGYKRLPDEAGHRAPNGPGKTETWCPGGCVGH